MSFEIVKPEHFVNLTRAQVKRILQTYMENELSRDIRVVSLNTNVNSDCEILATVYLKDES